MLLLKLEESGGESRSGQILRQIRQMIESGSLRPGEKLPSTRRLAERLGVHRSTVAIAYQELWSLGFIDLRPGACARVRRRVEIAGVLSRSEAGILNWGRISSLAAGKIRQSHERFLPRPGREGGSRVIDFSTLDMDGRILPVEQFRSSLNHVIRSKGAALFGYGDRAGYLPLREYIARRLRTHGVSVDADEILLTNGSQHAIDLVFRLIASPGRSVAVESPTYDHVLPLLRFYGLKALEVPLGRDGMDLARLEEIIEKRRPALVYTMPNFQNPTGLSTGQAHRERLLSICEKHRIPLLEDGFEEEMKYFGRVVLPIKSMDRHGIVIYCGTFSKVLFAGLRIGWLVAERDCVERLIAIRRFSDLSSGMILQAAMHLFCEYGYYDLHISRMHRVFRKRMQTALRALKEHVSRQWAEWREPGGGYLVWLKLKPVRSVDWNRLFVEHGVKPALGTLFFPSDTSHPCLRLSISSLNEEEIREGIGRLGTALRRAHRSR